MPAERDTNIYDMFVRILAFDAEHSGDYSALTMAADLFAIMLTAKSALEDYFAQQTSGERSAAVELQASKVAAAKRKMSRLARTARGIAMDSPGIEKLFTVPWSVGIDDFVARGREIVKAADSHKIELAAMGCPASVGIALGADLDAIEGAGPTKASALGDTVAATAGVEQQTDAGMLAAKKLDPIMRNVYDDNPVKYAEWKTARHVKRADQPSPPTPPTP